MPSRGKSSRKLWAAYGLSFGALLLAASNANAWAWHEGSYGSAVTAPTSGIEAYTTCSIPIPIGGTYNAAAGLHQRTLGNHAWVQVGQNGYYDGLYFQYGETLGYCPQARTRSRCSASASNWTGSTWHSAPWADMYPYNPVNGGQTSPNQECTSGSKPYLVQTRCKGRAYY